MKIKTKKQLNLPQLIEWAMDNDIKQRVFESNPNFDGVTYKLGFDIGGHLYFEEPLTPTLLFTVEVEEEIDEETKLGLLLDHFINPYGQHYVGNIYQNRSINDVLEENDEMEISTNSIHLFDKETKEFILIWRDGKMVE
ncbi:hypothetical protein ACU40P_03525 [Staphylococcus arlettae]